MSHLTLTELVAQLRHNQIDLEVFINSVCDVIEEKDPTFLALVANTYSRERILGIVRALVQKYPEPDGRPPLFGVPVGIKDIMYTDDLPTRCGSLVPGSVFPRKDGHCVSKLRKAGAVIMGKTETAEFAAFCPAPTRNPHNPKHTPGGSSSGSAAGVALNYFPVSLGSQTVGSVIRPASYCGTVGFKPSFGQMNPDGVYRATTSLDQLGMFCKLVEDIHVIAPLLLDKWDGKRFSTQSLQRIVFGIPVGPFLNQITENCRSHFVSHIEALESIGFFTKCVPIFDDYQNLQNNHRELMLGEMATSHTWYDDNKHLYRTPTVEMIEEGRRISSDELLKQQTVHKSFRGELHNLMNHEGVDMWLCPSSQDAAPPRVDETGSPWMNGIWTYAGVPVITVPMVFDKPHLPIGLQIVGKFGDDERLVAVADMIQKKLQKGVGVSSKL